MNREIRLLVKIPPAEVLRRLADVIDDAQPTGEWEIKMSNTPTFGGTKPFIGNLRDGKFFIQRRPRYKNSFTPALSGTVEPHSSGSLIEASFPSEVFGLSLKKISAVVFGFLAICIAMSAAMVLAGIYVNSKLADSLIIYGAMGLIIFIFLTVIAGIVGLFALITVAGRAVATDEKQELINFFESIYRDVKI